MRRIGTGLVMVLLALALPGVTFGETIEQRLERMEQEIRDLRSELKRRDAADHRHEAPPSRAKQARGATAAPAVAAETTAPATPAVAAAEPTPAPPASGPLRGLVDRVAIGGYGSTRFEASSLSGQNTTFTYRR